MDAILEVFVWDLSMLFGGCRAVARHDNEQWGDEDYLRSKKAGQRYGFHAVLLQAKGDWPWHSLLFNFPAHNSTNMCWRCKATQNGDLAYWHTGQHGEWRNHRYAPGEFLKELMRKSITPCPLFRLPGFTVDEVCLGVLHVMDLGVTAYTLGNIFFEALDWSGLAHRRREGRCVLLWEKLVTWYRVHNIPNQLQNLTVPMIKRDGQVPKLRCKGKQSRYLVRFGLTLAAEMHDMWHTWHTGLVLEIIMHLDYIYTLMKVDWDADAASASSMVVFHGLCQLADQANRMGWPTWSV